jgi:hypothetical protein
MRLGRAHRTHFIQVYGNPTPGYLPGCLAPGETTTDDRDGLHALRLKETLNDE